MASKTQVTERIRNRKIHTQGKVRKRKIRREGSTRSHKELFGE